LIGERKREVDSHNRGNHFALLVNDLDAWERHFAELGVAFLPRRTRPDGALQIYVVDPDGHYVELCTLAK
jgi:catechol 2,3-dioxygenase-like lactoylglutathione lyase family enzyme